MAKLIPPGNASRFCGLHWVQQVLKHSADMPGYIALQWNPGSQTWTHSDEHDVYGAKIFNLQEGQYRYVKPIDYPDLGE